MGRTVRYPSIRSAMVVSVLLALAPALAIVTWTGLEQGRYLADQSRQETARQLEAFAGYQERVSDAVRQILTTIASLPDFREGEADSMTAILRAVHAINPGYVNFTAVDVSGSVTASSRLPPGTWLGERLHLRLALANGRMEAGEYVLAATDAEPSFPFALPILSPDGRIAGAIATLYRLSSYDGLFETFSLPEGSFLGMVDAKGIRVYFYPAKDTNPLGKPIKAEVWERMLRMGDAGSFVETGSDGIARNYAFKALRLSPGHAPYMYLVFGMPTAIAEGRSRRILARNLALMAAVGLLGTFFARESSRILFGKRLARIIATTSLIREGNLSARLGTGDDSPDLGQIATALDLMAGTVERRAEERERYALRLAESLRGKEMLLKEIHHRVKNNLQLVLSLIQMQGDASGDLESFKAAMETRISSMALVHEMLYETSDDRGVDLGEYARRILELILQTGRGASGVGLELDLAAVEVELERAVPFGLLVNELATNAFKHAFADGRGGTLRVSLSGRGGRARLELADDGPGLPPGFDPCASRGLGLRLACALAEQLGGKLAWGVAQGARFSLEFPAGGQADSSRSSGKSAGTG